MKISEVREAMKKAQQLSDKTQEEMKGILADSQLIADKVWVCGQIAMRLDLRDEKILFKEVDGDVTAQNLRDAGNCVDALNRWLKNEGELPESNSTFNEVSGKTAKPNSSFREALKSIFEGAE